jgi:hypothetical protein
LFARCRQHQLQQTHHLVVIDPARNFFKQQMMSHCVKGSHYTLPIGSTFPRELQLSALGIRLKVNLSTFFGQHTDKADWC